MDGPCPLHGESTKLLKWDLVRKVTHENAQKMIRMTPNALRLMGVWIEDCVI